MLDFIREYGDKIQLVCVILMLVLFWLSERNHKKMATTSFQLGVTSGVLAYGIAIHERISKAKEGEVTDITSEEIYQTVNTQMEKYGKCFKQYRM